MRPKGLPVLISLLLLLAGCGVAARKAAPPTTVQAGVRTILGTPSEIVFADPTHGFLLVSQNCSQEGTTPCPETLFRTGDGGRAWFRVAELGNPLLGKLVFTSPTRGYATAFSPLCETCGGSLVATADGGTTWDPVLHAPGPLYDVLATSRGAVLAAGGAPPQCAGTCPGFVERSPDGGRTWTAVSLPWTIQGVGWPGGTAFVALDGRGRIYRSTDGGASWTPGAALGASLAPANVRFQFLSPERGWVSFCNLAAVGNGGCEDSVFRTLDGGRTWHQVVKTYCTLDVSVHMRSPSDGLMAKMGETACQSPGSTNALFGTTDGGRTWALLRAFGLNISSAAFAGGEVWLAGTSCLEIKPSCTTVVYRSSDGRRWSGPFPSAPRP